MLLQWLTVLHCCLAITIVFKVPTQGDLSLWVAFHLPHQLEIENDFEICVYMFFQHLMHYVDYITCIFIL